MIALVLLVCGAAPPAQRDATLPKEAIAWIGLPAHLTIHYATQSVAFWPDGKVLVCAARDGVRFLHLPTGRWQRFVPAPDSGMASNRVLLDRDGRTALFVSDWGFMQAYDLRRARPLSTIKTKDRLQAVVLSADGSTIARAEDNSARVTVRAWDTATGKELMAFSVPVEGAKDCTLALSPDGKLLAAVLEDADGVVYSGLVRTTNCKEVASFGALPVSCMAFSPDGKTLAVLRSGAVSLHDGRTGKPKRDIAVKGLEPASAAFSPDGRLLALAMYVYGKKELALLELASGKMRWEWTERLGPSRRALAFSPRGRRLASGRLGGGATLWDVTGRYSLRGGATRDTVAGLSSRSGEKGGKAIGELVRSPREGVGLLRKGVRPGKAPLDEEKIKQLIALADDADPAIAARAKAALIGAGYRALSPLRVARREAKDRGTREGLERLIEEASHPVARALLRELRAVEALEKILTPEARKLLAEWAAKGWRSSDLTEAAKAALDRDKKRR
jgi:hypothetical protein